MSEVHPPKWIRNMLRRVCRPELLEEIEGDLLEFYEIWKGQYGRKKADRLYVWHTIKFLRPFALKRTTSTHSGRMEMMKHNFLISYRTLLHKKGYSVINIGGLAIGMIVAIFIGLWINDELAFNTYHKNHDRIVEVFRNETHQGHTSTHQVHAPEVGTLLQNEYGSLFEQVAMVRSRLENRVISAGDKQYSQHGYFMQPEGPHIFGLRMLSGSRDGLADVSSILLSASLAVKLFGEKDPLNEVVQLNANSSMTVAGVYEDLPKNSDFRDASFFAPFDKYLEGRQATLNTWDNQFVRIYGLLRLNVDEVQASLQIRDAMRPHIRDGVDNEPELFLHPMKDWHLGSAFENGRNVTSQRMRFIWIYGIIGVFVLLLACVNFMNLSTARSEKRAKEIGIRKVMGSVRYQLIEQFLAESFIISLIAFGLSCFIVSVTLPWFNGFTDKDLLLPFDNAWFWLSGAGFTLLTALLAGSYPAFYLSSFRPLQVLKSNPQTGRFSTVPRKVLVVFQFAVSMLLIVATLIVMEQVDFAKNRPVGYNRAGLISFSPASPDFIGKYDVLRAELKSTGVVQEIAGASYPITSTRGNNDFFNWKGKGPSFRPTFNTVDITYEYGKTIGWELLQGRDFSREFESDKTGIIITESARNVMQLEAPVGEKVTITINNDLRITFTIIGVVRDLIKGSPFEPAVPSIMFLSRVDQPWLFIRLKPDASPGEALPKIQEAFHRIVPSAPFDYKFVDDEFSTKFRDEEQVADLAGIFSLLAIVISCLGLLGLAAHVAEQRTKEIGIRKVLGATVTDVWALVSKEFVLLIFISILISTPVAYYFLSTWLEGYTYRVEIGWQAFLLAAFGTVAITFLTVSFQTLRAAFANPVESLKDE